MSDQSSEESSRFQFLSLLDGGSFGDVFLARDTLTKAMVVIKVEKKDSSKRSQLWKEKIIYQSLVDQPGFAQIEKMFQTEHDLFLAMTPLGKNLEHYFNLCKRRFSEKTILMIGYQMVLRIEAFHHHTDRIHRDIKPGNIVMGLEENCRTLYLIDFGLAKYFRDKQGVLLSERPRSGSLVGTALYASLNAHKGYDQSRRDDLESLIFTLIYFNLGTLPWQGVKSWNKEERNLIMRDMKRTEEVEKYRNNILPEIITCFRRIRSMKFSDTPDYGDFKSILMQGLLHRKCRNDGKFDWV